MAFKFVFSSGKKCLTTRYHEINYLLPFCIHFRSGCSNWTIIRLEIIFKDLSLCQRLSVMQTIKGCKMYCRQNFQGEPLCEGPGTLITRWSDTQPQKATAISKPSSRGKTVQRLVQRLNFNRASMVRWNSLLTLILLNENFRRSWTWSIDESWFDSLLRSYVYAISRPVWSSIWRVTESEE